MDILEKAIQAEHGVGKLAKALGIRQNVVSNWRARGLPKPWDHVLRLKYMPESMQAPANIAQPATKAVAGQGA